MSVSCLQLRPLDVQVSESVKVKLYEACSQEEALDIASEAGVDPFGMMVWPSAIGATTALLEEKSLKGIHVLELGSGPGLVSFTAAQLGAIVTATDISSVALQLLHAGAEHSPNVTVRELDVCDTEAVIAAVKAHDLPCLIVATDLIYEAPVAAKLAHALALSCHSYNAAALVSDPGRPEGRAAFLKALVDFESSLEGGESSKYHHYSSLEFKATPVPADLAQAFRLSTPPPSSSASGLHLPPAQVGLLRLGTLPSSSVPSSLR